MTDRETNRRAIEALKAQYASDVEACRWEDAGQHAGMLGTLCDEQFGSGALWWLCQLACYATGEQHSVEAASFVREGLPYFTGLARAGQWCWICHLLMPEGQEAYVTSLSVLAIHRGCGKDLL